MALGSSAPGSGYRFEDVTVHAAPPRRRRSVPRSEPVTILDHLDLAIPTGLLTVVAGPSGSGKSTLLRLCNRLEVPTGGRVLLDGDDLGARDPLELRRRAAMVFQRPVTFAGTVGENLLVAEPGLERAQVAGALERVGLDPQLIDRRADDLSGGEAQRLCIARSLLTEPSILLMDEATSALDVDARTVIEQLVRQLLRDGLTVIWVTHDLEQAERIADRIVVVLAGRVADDDTARRALARRSFTARSVVESGGSTPGAVTEDER